MEDLHWLDALPLTQPTMSKHYYYYLLLLLFVFYPRYLFPREDLKIDENDWKGMMLSPCSQRPAGCRVAEQHWNAAPALKLADTIIIIFYTLGSKDREG